MDERQLRKKHDRELIELLNELRVALPGVQVLFAFLLVVPFSSRFDVDRTEKVAYMIALLATVVGTILLIAPSAYHRLRWREKNKERMLRTSNRLAIGGLGAVAVAISRLALPRHRRAAAARLGGRRHRPGRRRVRARLVRVAALAAVRPLGRRGARSAPDGPGAGLQTRR